MLQLTSFNMHKIATEPSDSSWMKACRTNSGIRFSTHKGDTIEPPMVQYTPPNPSGQDQGQHKLWSKRAHTHTNTHTHTQSLSHLKSNRSPHHSAPLSTDGSHWYSAHQLSQKQPLNLHAYSSSFYAGGVHSTQ